MPVHVKGKSNGCMSKVFRYGLRVISSTQRSYCISMPEVMKANIRQAKLFHNALKVHVYRIPCYMVAKVVSKHITAIHPSTTGKQLFLCLLSPNGF